MGKGLTSISLHLLDETEHRTLARTSEYDGITRRNMKGEFSSAAEPRKLRRSCWSKYLTFRRCMLAAVIVCLVLLLARAGKSVLPLFRWAEKRVDANSPWHMALALAVTVPFNLGIPIPIVHQVWCVAIGTCFRWKAFPLLFAMLTFGVPLPFLIGRRLANGNSVALEAQLRRLAPRAVAFVTPLRRVVAARPVRTSFLLMWAPLPTSSLPLLLGFLIPSSELPLRSFMAGAFPSNLIHFACDVLVGLEAHSLTAAFDAHEDLPGVEDLDLVRGDQTRARRISIATMCLTALFMAAMLRTMHAALRDIGQASDGELEA